MSEEREVFLAIVDSLIVFKSKNEEGESLYVQLQVPELYRTFEYEALYTQSLKAQLSPNKGSDLEKFEQQKQALLKCLEKYGVNSYEKLNNILVAVTLTDAQDEVVAIDLNPTVEGLTVKSVLENYDYAKDHIL